MLVRDYCAPTKPPLKNSDPRLLNRLERCHPRSHEPDRYDDPWPFASVTRVAIKPESKDSHRITSRTASAAASAAAAPSAIDTPAAADLSASAQRIAASSIAVAPRPEVEAKCTLVEVPSADVEGTFLAAAAASDAEALFVGLPAIFTTGTKVGRTANRASFCVFSYLGRYFLLHLLS